MLKTERHKGHILSVLLFRQKDNKGITVNEILVEKCLK
nr:MAG TPA: hypothetical protein [Caudoviricetes sp.]